MRKKIKSFKRKQVLSAILKWITLIVPYFVLFLIYRKDWVSTTDDKISFGIGGIVCLVVMVLVICGKAKFMSYGISKWIVVILAAWFFKTALANLLVVLCGGFAGYIGYAIFSITEKNNKAKYIQYLQAARTQEVLNCGEKLEFDKNGNLK